VSLVITNAQQCVSFAGIPRYNTGGWKEEEAVSVLAFESLVHTHTNAREDHVETECQVFSATIVNAMTDIQADITCLEDEANS